MLTVRRAGERGISDFGWLFSRHTFSFGEYQDRAQMGFGLLRVINEDRIQGGTGFDTHGHRDMEIVSYVVSGELKHKDSMGNATVIKPGEVQRMSAGTGVRHSEYNALPARETHFLQIWIHPERAGLPPGYGQKDFSAALKKNELTLVVSKTARDGSIAINQDADVYLARWEAGRKRAFAVRPGRRVWVQLIEGDLSVSGATLEEGDGLAAENEKSLELAAKDGAHFLLFDLE